MKFSHLLDTYLNAREAWMQVRGSKYYEAGAYKRLQECGAELDAAFAALATPPAKADPAAKPASKPRR
jgi:hypothetical protein